MAVRLTLWALICFTLISCSTTDATKEYVTFWHFWSEPDQRTALDSIIADFHKANPTIRIDATPLQWSDGKAKLQIAFNAKAAPDVVHIGMDWFPAFASAGVLKPLDSTWTTKAPLPSIRHFLRYNNQRYAIPWLVNARARIIWGDRKAIGTAPGFCVSDPHNVLKRNLPYLWSTNPDVEDVGTTYPVSPTLDTACVQALITLRHFSTSLHLATSRQLDEDFLQHKILEVYSGIWLVDKLPPTVFILTGKSILNADVLCVNASTAKSESAKIFTAFLQRPEQRARLYMGGFSPVEEELRADTLGFLRRGFGYTIMESVPIVNHPAFLEIEPILEDMIERSLRATSDSDVPGIVTEAALAIRNIESRSQ